MQRKLHPGRVNAQASPRNSEIAVSKAAASSGMSNKFKTVEAEAPPKTVGSKMIKTRQLAEKNFIERKAAQFP